MPPPAKFFSTPPNPQAVVDKVFGNGSQIDYAMAQVVPLFELFAEKPEANIQRVYEMTQLAPDRMIFCGGTDPVIRGLRQALDDITTQIHDMGAKSIKLYNAHSLGASWRMDDRSLAYPMYERMLELGCNLVQVHKGDPQGMEPLDFLRPDDVHQAALDFPDMNFIVHHLAFPFEDSAIDLGSRHPNVYLSMSTWINLIKIAPMETAMRFGKMLAWCAPDKILWGSETPLWPSAQHLLDLSYDFQIPEELQAGWGFPEITAQDRKLMFGGNMLRLLNMAEAPSDAHRDGQGGYGQVETHTPDHVLLSREP
jgi:predicted TIM-barrel fold metal-dependent hydrolase